MHINHSDIICLVIFKCDIQVIHHAYTTHIPVTIGTGDIEIASGKDLHSELEHDHLEERETNYFYLVVHPTY